MNKPWNWFSSHSLFGPLRHCSFYGGQMVLNFSLCFSSCNNRKSGLPKTLWAVWPSLGWKAQLPLVLGIVMGLHWFVIELWLFKVAWLIFVLCGKWLEAWAQMGYSLHKAAGVSHPSRTAGLLTAYFGVPKSTSVKTAGLIHGRALVQRHFCYVLEVTASHRDSQLQCGWQQHKAMGQGKYFIRGHYWSLSTPKRLL